MFIVYTYYIQNYTLLQPHHKVVCYYTTKIITVFKTIENNGMLTYLIHNKIIVFHMVQNLNY